MHLATFLPTFYSLPLSLPKFSQPPPNPSAFPERVLCSPAVSQSVPNKPNPVPPLDSSLSLKHLSHPPYSQSRYPGRRPHPPCKYSTHLSASYSRVTSASFCPTLQGRFRPLECPSTIQTDTHNSQITLLYLEPWSRAASTYGSRTAGSRQLSDSRRNYRKYGRECELTYSTFCARRTLV